MSLFAADACSSLPRSGPNGSDLITDGGAAQKRFAVIEIAAPIVNTLAEVKPPSFAGVFGDYRPPRLQRIGVGDSVQITLWEAGSGGCSRHRWWIG
jgi:polysaccharide biosynthesis/export protein